MENHKETYCPKCDAKFTCKTGDIIHCQCYSVPLSDETKDFLSKTSFDCLCENCLKKADNNVKIAGKLHFPKQKVKLEEGVHYYNEGSYCVFTERYHMLRGYCCRNGCRHCPYGFQKDNNREKEEL